MITFELGIDGLPLEMRMFDYVLNVCAFTGEATQLGAYISGVGGPHLGECLGISPCYLQSYNSRIP